MEANSAQASRIVPYWNRNPLAKVRFGITCNAIILIITLLKLCTTSCIEYTYDSDNTF